MKKLSFYTTIALFLFSCEDQLEEVPQDFISNVNFWQTEEDVLLAIKGIYEVDLIGPFNDQFLELHSDFAKGRGSWTSISNWDAPMDNTHIDRSDQRWYRRLYLAINRANGVLDNVPDMDIAEDRKNPLMAEARFMRAWNYFMGVRMYGPIPLKLEATKDLTTIDSPRTPIAAVYDVIIEDLTFAETHLPNSFGADTRRPSKWAAKMVLAQVHLTLENWSTAASKAEEVINSGEFAIIPVSEPDDFYEIFAKRPTTEDIMSIHYSATQQDSYIRTLHMGNIPVYNAGSRGFFTTLPVTTTIIGDAWDDNDLRKSFNLYTEYVDTDGSTVSLPAQFPIMFKKYIAKPDGTRSNARYYLRFSENYLIYAEAAAMASGSPTEQALEYLNIVRRRAYGFDPFAPSPADYPAGMSISEFRDAVILERAYEFINEHRRWFDLVRTGTVEEAIGAAFGVVVHPSRLLWPIPQDEINNNALISQSDQNPGY